MAQREIVGAAALSRTRSSRLFYRPRPALGGMTIGYKARGERVRTGEYLRADAEGVPYCITFQRETCNVRAGARLRQCRADSISASLAPWLRAHISAAEAEYLAT